MAAGVSSFVIILSDVARGICVLAILFSAFGIPAKLCFLVRFLDIISL